MFDLSPEALTEGPIHHQEREGDGMPGIRAKVEAGDLESMGGSGTKTENVQL